MVSSQAPKPESSDVRVCAREGDVRGPHSRLFDAAVLSAALTWLRAPALTLLALPLLRTHPGLPFFRRMGMHLSAHCSVLSLLMFKKPLRWVLLLRWPPSGTTCSPFSHPPLTLNF